MKSIFQNLFESSRKVAAEPAVPLQLPATVDDLHEHQKRALIGWIASRMGQLLRLDKAQSGTLIYLSFSMEAFPDKPDGEYLYLLYLSSCLVDWFYQETDVYMKIKEMRLLDKYHKCLLEVFEEIKRDIGRYLSTEIVADVPLQTEEDEIWEVYRDVIYAATHGKFLLIRKDEVNRYKEGSILCESSISERSDIPKARERAKECLIEIGVQQSAMMSHLLVISEAITNILKHARDGKMMIFANDDLIRVLVEDNGLGFPLKLLPNATLMAGYSTKKSLGQGFTLMMKMAEQVLLSTTPGEGSRLILVFNRK